MTQASDFYQVLGVSPDSEPGTVKESVRERVDQFRQQVEEADDPDAVRSRLLLAYEVLTDPEERYLYELYGHEEYMNKRLDGQELQDISGLGGESLTPVFSGDASTSDTQVFDPADDTTDTRIFDPQASDSEVAGATTTVGGSDDAETDSPDTPDGPDAAETAIREDAVEGEQTVVREEGGDSDEEEEDLSELSQRTTLIDRLSKFPLSKSPATRLPGVGAEAYHIPAALAYGIVFLGGVFAVGMFLPFGSVVMGAATVIGFLTGAGATYVAGTLKYDRQLTYRSGVGIAASAPVLLFPSVGFATTTPGSVLMYGAGLAGLFGISTANTYVEATRRQMRESRKEKQGRGGRNYTSTDPTVGETDDDVEAADILEQLVESEHDRTSRPPKDLVEESTIHSTREFVPERHIFRVLSVEDERTGREVPVSDFSAVRSKLREDVDNRNNNHPSGFHKQTDKYLVPSSVTEQTCPKCTGSTTIQCPNCDGQGKVACSKCGGDTRYKCRSCNGKGRDSNGDLCSKCRGEGYIPCDRCSSTGVETCSTCSGKGIVTCDRCEGDGRVVQFTQLTRTYEPNTEVEYETQSLPEEVLHSPDGNQVQKDRKRNHNPDAISGDWFFKEHEIREIPTNVVTYEYAGDLWEAYEMEDGVKSPTYPRELGRRVQALSMITVASAILMAYVVSVGPSGLP